MPTLLPFRDYDEHDVINLFRLANADTLPVNKGTLVKLADTTGWKNSQETDLLGSAGGLSINGVVSDRYGVAANVTASGLGDRPLGMLLYDVKETDENGEKLIYNPRKAAEMEAVLSGQAVPVVTRGLFLYSGATLVTDAVNAGQNLYGGASGELTDVASQGSPTVNNHLCGYALGGLDSNLALVKLEL